MYRHTASSYMMKHSLPSPEYTGDSDSDSEIIQELEQKRRELDEEIARFKAQKDKEFKDFEDDLRSRRKQKRNSQQITTGGRNNVQKSSNSSNQPLSSGSQRGGEGQSKSNAVSLRKQKEPMRLMKSDIRMQATSPTLCLEKMNITAQNAPNSRESQTGTTSHGFNRPSSQSSSESIPYTPPLDKSPILSQQKYTDTALNGLFVPSYLPLLDAKLKSQYDPEGEPIVESQTEPTSPNHSLLAEAASLHSSSLPSSLPSESHTSSGFEVQTDRRAYTAPTVPTRSLAPIIRNVNGRKASVRKRKRVTFQLADRAIVDPSSSYEEGPSPSLDSDKSSDTSSTRSSNVSPRIKPRRKQRDQFGRTVSDEKSGTKTEEVGMGMGDLLMASEYGDPSAEFFAQKTETVQDDADGYFSPKEQHNAVEVDEDGQGTAKYFGHIDDNRYLLERRDKLRQGRLSSQDLLMSPPIPKSPTVPGMEAPIDPNAKNNVGFFELDEELASPGGNESKPFELEIVDDGISGKDDTELEDRASAKAIPESRENIAAAFTVGSVPIAINKRNSNSWSGSLTSSWIGTFGH